MTQLSVISRVYISESWNCAEDDDDINTWGHAAIRSYSNESEQDMRKGFKGFHLRQPCSASTDTRAFVFVSGLEDLRQTIVDSGWTQVGDIYRTGWGVNAFNLTDLNGFTFEFCEWAC